MSERRRDSQRSQLQRLFADLFSGSIIERRSAAKSLYRLPCILDKDGLRLEQGNTAIELLSNAVKFNIAQRRKDETDLNRWRIFVRLASCLAKGPVKASSSARRSIAESLNSLASALFEEGPMTPFDEELQMPHWRLLTHMIIALESALAVRNVIGGAQDDLLETIIQLGTDFDMLALEMAGPKAFNFRLLLCGELIALFSYIAEAYPSVPARKRAFVNLRNNFISELTMNLTHEDPYFRFINTEIVFGFIAIFENPAMFQCLLAVPCWIVDETRVARLDEEIPGLIQILYSTAVHSDAYQHQRRQALKTITQLVGERQTDRIQSEVATAKALLG